MRTFKNIALILLIQYSISLAQIIHVSNDKNSIQEALDTCSAGDTVLVPPGAKQFVKNTGQEELQFYCIVSPPWKDENDKLIE